VAVYLRYVVEDPSIQIPPGILSWLADRIEPRPKSGGTPAKRGRPIELSVEKDHFAWEMARHVQNLARAYHEKKQAYPENEAGTPTEVAIRVVAKNEKVGKRWLKEAMKEHPLSSDSYP
jgi:hypothetical protein